MRSAALALQRTIGNHATGRLLRERPVGAGAALRRFASINVGWGPQEAPTFQQRRPPAGPGFTPGSANRGWIRIGARAAPGTPIVQTPIHHAVSQFGVAHTEELLLQWAALQGVNFPSLAPTNPAIAPRVLAIYSERQPCNAHTAEPARAGRPGANCQNWLTAQLHATTPVYWSSPNNLAAHNALMLRHQVLHIRATENDRLHTAYVHRLAALPQGPHPGLLAIYTLWRNRQSTVLPVGPGGPVPVNANNYGNWAAAMALRTNIGIAAINAWTPAPPVLPMPAPGGGGPGGGGGGPGGGGPGDGRAAKRLRVGA